VRRGRERGEEEGDQGEHGHLRTRSLRNPRAARTGSGALEFGRFLRPWCFTVNRNLKRRA
jgi:hypothetical protein